MSNPLAEVFGYPIQNKSNKAERFRNNKLCPFHNKVPSCTKNSATDPLGVCSIFFKDKPVITCPIRFTEDWQFTDQAAKFFFDEKTFKAANWTTVREVRLDGADGKSAGNIDYVLVAYDNEGNVIDFGSIEIQAVYISGNVTKPFKAYMKNREDSEFDWSNYKDSPRPDYLSSSRKRLAPQLIYKGGILKSWGKKQVVVLQKGFFETLPILPKTESVDEADMAWLVFDLSFNEGQLSYELKLEEAIYTEFKPALDEIITPKPGNIDDFIQNLQKKLDKTLDDISPEAPSLTDIISK